MYLTSSSSSSSEDSSSEDSSSELDDGGGGGGVFLDFLEGFLSAFDGVALSFFFPEDLSAFAAFLVGFGGGVATTTADFLAFLADFSEDFFDTLSFPMITAVCKETERERERERSGTWSQDGGSLLLSGPTIATVQGCLWSRGGETHQRREN